MKVIVDFEANPVLLEAALTLVWALLESADDTDIAALAVAQGVAPADVRVGLELARQFLAGFVADLERQNGGELD